MLSLLLLFQSPIVKIYFETILSIICYEAIFIIFFSDKIHYISMGLGNERTKYVKFFKSNKCEEHRSYTCGCSSSPKIYITQDDKLLIDNYIVILNTILSFKYFIKRKLNFV